MEKIYSIDEILKAVNEIQTLKKKKEENINLKNKSNKKDKIPESTLRLIEQAENSIKKFLPMQISTKLPNDLLVNREKICGILQETINFDER